MSCQNPQQKSCERRIEKLSEQVEMYRRENSRLERELALMKHFFDHSLTASAILDRDFNFIRVNSRYAQADNRTPEELVGQNHFELYPSDAEEIFRQVVETKQPYQTFSRPFIYANNPERGITYWDWTLVPVLDENDQVELLLYSLNNVTQRRKAELEMSRFFDLSPDLSCVVNMADQRILRVNKAFCTALGYSVDEARNMKFSELVQPEDVKVAINLLGRLEKNEAISQITCGHRCKDGTIKHVTWNCVPDVESQEFLAMGTDVTEIVKFHEEMVRVERLKLLGQMAAIVGHEVKNPLTSARALLQLMAIKSEDKKTKDNLNLVIKEVDRTADIIMQFLSLAREKPLNRKLHNLNEILDEMTPLVQASASELGLNFQLQLENIPKLMLDREEICQLVLNLAHNGLQAMSPGGTLTIKTTVESNKVVLAIQDEGEGISPDILDKIGTPFFTTKEHGTGLGVAVCKQIADRHQAMLRFEPLETGTVVCVDFDTEKQT